MKRRVSISSPVEPSDFQPIDTLFAQKIFPEATAEGAFLLASLMKSAREGHLCLSIKDNAKLKEGLAQLPETLFEEFLFCEEDRIYLKRNWVIERDFKVLVKTLLQQKPSHPIPESILHPKLASRDLNEEQKRAILKAAERSLTLITGGPGTGKTYTASHLISLFFECGLKRVALAAPTGKASSNLRQALGSLAGRCEAQTLHSLLKGESLHADLILVDEGSMIDAPLMLKLFKMLPRGARLILLGDRYQLPPVESGNLFLDLAHLSGDHVSELKICKRTELKEIIELALRVKRGEIIPAMPLPDLKTLLDFVMREECHLLTPLRKGIFGVDHLNRMIFAEEQKRGSQKIPIMVTVNDTYLELFNGDTGVLNLEEKVACFSGGRQFEEHLLPPYEYAYALSVHKSQGSEYEKVMIVLPEGSERFGREMLYTAITRAKKEITLFAHEGVIEKLVQTSSRRYSGFAYS